MKLPPHVEDQLSAALVETGRRAAVGGVPVPAGGQLDGFWRSLQQKVNAGPVQQCPHLRGDAPRPVWIASWAPLMVACDLCWASGWVTPPDPIEDRTCDVCGKYKSGGTHPAKIALFLATIVFGICERCATSPKE
jgi:hypothetical protein